MLVFACGCEYVHKPPDPDTGAATIKIKGESGSEEENQRPGTITSVTRVGRSSRFWMLLFSETASQSIENALPHQIPRDRRARASPSALVFSLPPPLPLPLTFALAFALDPQPRATLRA